MEDNGHKNITDWILRLYEEESARLLLYGRALGLSQTEAEDILHETFLALLKLKSPPAQPASYCVRSFRNRALNFKRNMWRRIKHEIESFFYFKTESNNDWFVPALSANFNDDVCKLAMKSLESLPVKQREVIVLKIWNRLTFDEISDILGISPNTAAGRYRYGLERIKKSFLAYEKEYIDRERNRGDVASASTAFTLARG